MKKLLLIITFIMVFQAQDTRVVNNRDDLDTMMEVTAEMNVTLEEWQDVFVEELTLRTFKELKHLLSETYTIQKDSTEQSNKYTFTPKKSTASNQLQHEIEAVIPKENKQEVKIHVVLSGEEWNETNQMNYTHLINRLRNDFEFELEMSFTCVKLNEDGILDNDYFIRNIMSKLEAIHIDEQHDNVVDSVYQLNIYGNSTLFHHAMNVENQQINFQVAIRETTNQKRQVILGTPLILNEY